ncbi:MAG: manganese efflux pump MntP family protein [Planctomycetota bacterium]
MTLATIALTGLALAADAAAVCVSSALSHPHIAWTRLLRLPVVFGAFQAGMPALGWLCAASLRERIADVDHWIAFGLLAWIGASMVRASFARDTGVAPRDPLRPGVLLALAFGTSVDALAAGVGLGSLQFPLGESCVGIGVITFLTCVPALALGRRLGPHFGPWAERVGGVVLFGLGVKILFEHLSA